MRPSIVIALNQQFATAANRRSPKVTKSPFFRPSAVARRPYAQSIEHEAGHFFALTRDPIEPPPSPAKILRGEDGAFVNFEGVARNNSKGRATQYLEYECYEPMAVKVMA